MSFSRVRECFRVTGKEAIKLFVQQIVRLPSVYQIDSLLEMDILQKAKKEEKPVLPFCSFSLSGRRVREHPVRDFGVLRDNPRPSIENWKGPEKRPRLSRGLSRNPDTFLRFLHTLIHGHL